MLYDNNITTCLVFDRPNGQHPVLVSDLPTIFRSVKVTIHGENMICGDSCQPSLITMSSVKTTDIERKGGFFNEAVIR